MKKFLSLILALGMVASLAACGGSSSSGDASSDSSTDSSASAPAASAKLRFVTGGESGTYYAFGSVIAQHATNNTNVAVTGLVGNGSKSNVEELADGNAELAFCQSDVMAYAYNGTNLFEQPIDCFSTVAALYMEDVQIVTTDPSIKTVADLAGKNVSVGAAGSGVYFNAVDILSAYGLGDLDADGKFTKINATYQSFGDSADSLKDGKIDAAFIVAGAPTTAITDLSTTKTAYLISLDQAHIQQLIAENNFYSEAVIPAGTYAGQTNDVVTVGVDAVIIVDNAVSEEDVYALTADIFDNAPDLIENHAKYAEISLEKGASVASVPYHPGAAKYFAEKNITVPTK
mgnify:CR=1 FL=1